jgi:hypothetical protein
MNPGHVTGYALIAWILGIAVLGIVIAYGLIKAGRLSRAERKRVDLNAVAARPRSRPTDERQRPKSKPDGLDHRSYICCPHHRNDTIYADYVTSALFGDGGMQASVRPEAPKLGPNLRNNLTGQIL